MSVLKKRVVGTVAITILIAGFMLASLERVSAQSVKQCEEGIFMHGFLSRAQFQCDFSQYSPRILEYVRICINRYSMSEKGSRVSSLGV